MKFIKGLLIIMTICLVMVSCTINEEEDKSSAALEDEINVLSPVNSEETKDDLAKHFDASDDTVFLKSSFDDTFTKCIISIEAYQDGDLMTLENVVEFDVKNSLDLAILMRDVGQWDVKASSEETIISSNIGAVGESAFSDDLLKAWSYLNYPVDIKRSEAQIIGINYVDDGGSIGHYVSVYEDNDIFNMYQYDFLYLLKIKFE